MDGKNAMRAKVHMTSIWPIPRIFDHSQQYKCRLPSRTIAKALKIGSVKVDTKNDLGHGASKIGNKTDLSDFASVMFASYATDFSTGISILKYAYA